MNLPGDISRRRFLSQLLTAAVWLPGGLALAADRDGLRGDRVGWARLKTPGQYWMRHAEGDPTLMRFFREQTTLNIDPNWYVADVEDFSQMCQYPLLFSQGVQMVASTTGRANLAEYVRRGGFLLVDDCCNRGITPDFAAYYRQHLELLAAILPEARVVELPASHEIYRCHFQIPDGHPPHTYDQNVYDPVKAAYGLAGIMMGSRMAGILSLSGLQCGWARMLAPAGHDVVCMKMLVNIYIYALTQGG